MRAALRRLACGAIFGLGVASCSWAAAGTVIPHNFNEYNTSVNGYQDFFTGTTFNSAWTAYSNGAALSSPTATGSAFSLPGDGTLHMGTAANDPNKLLYKPASSYANGVTASQTVLAMIQETTNPTNGGDGFRGGVTGASDATTAKGVNLLFRPTDTTDSGAAATSDKFNLLNDGQAWGPVVPPTSGGTGQLTYAANTYYWVRETVFLNAPAGTAGLGSLANGTNDYFAKIWPADGTTAEPGSYLVAWDNNNAPGGNGGLLGLASDSLNGTAAFQVNYALLEGSGLPTITAGAVPEPASLGLLGFGGLGLLARRRRAR